MTPTFTPNTGASCGNGGGLTCSAGGVCGGCTSDAQCPSDTFCSNWSCNTTSSLCERAITAENTPLPNGVEGQVVGNCVELQCNAEGGTKTVNDDDDFVDDGNECTFEFCDAGTLQEGDEDQGEVCTDGGTLCDGSGNCVSCTQDADCNAQDTFCMDFSCNAGSCQGAPITANIGQPLPTGQQAGNCQVLQCAANGMPTSVADDADVPSDTNPNDCNVPVCTGGATSTAPRSEGDTCSDGGVVCNATGSCVACIVGDTRCDGLDTFCSDFSCAANNTCQGAPRNEGQATPTGQSAGNCQTIRCVAGSAQSQADDTDLPPSDNNDCTTESCVAGAPSFGNAAPATSCSSANPAADQCDGSGNCVECLAATAVADCGATTECQTNACVTGFC